MKAMDDRYRSGVNGELEAENYLKGLGMTCLERRYRAGDGEIDLIMQDGEVIAFVEVKNRPHSAPGQGLLAITPAKRRRMTHAAAAYLLQKDLFSRQIRFDALEITSGGVIYIPNAFQPLQWD